MSDFGRNVPLPRHFLDLDLLDGATLRGILTRSAAMKRGRPLGRRGAVEPDRPLDGRVLALVFDKPSTRTRVSFDVAMRQLGGQTLMLNSSDLQLGRGETVGDTARVLSRYVDGVMIRTNRHSKLTELAKYATVPVINGLTDDTHPCQIMADVMTYEEHRGAIEGRTVAWCGDGNNVAASWIHAAVRFNFRLRLACPKGVTPAKRLLDWADAEGGRIGLTISPEEAVKGADCVVTDTWASMGQDDKDKTPFVPFQVNERLMTLAAKDALFMHCLPAHRGEEVTEGVIDGPQSVVWDQAENRLHAQKGILAWCMG
jgi:ornithine carbamoyltransferase